MDRRGPYTLATANMTEEQRWEWFNDNCLPSGNVQTHETRYINSAKSHGAMHSEGVHARRKKRLQYFNEKDSIGEWYKQGSYSNEWGI